MISRLLIYDLSIAALCNILAMGFFHGAEYMELNVVTDSAGVQAPYSMFFAKDFSEV